MLYVNMYGAIMGKYSSSFKNQEDCNIGILVHGFEKHNTACYINIQISHTNWRQAFDQ
jgi:hypothetical protein